MAHPPDPGSARGRPVVGWILIVGLVVVLPAVGAYVWLGPSSSADRAGTAAGQDSAMPERLGVDVFADRLADGEVVVINVHIPYEGEIEGTDLFIPYDRIAEDPQVPADRSTAIALYCRSGRMSREAAGTLAAKGYTNVADLDGGMQAWEAAGQQVVVSESRPPSTQVEAAEAQRPSSLRRPGEGSGTSNPGGFVVLGLLVASWAVGLGVVLHRHRSAATPGTSGPRLSNDSV